MVHCETRFHIYFFIDLSLVPFIDISSINTVFDYLIHEIIYGELSENKLMHFIRSLTKINISARKQFLKLLFVTL